MTWSKTLRKCDQFWVNQAAFRPKLICAPAACALRAIAREKIIITRQTDHQHKIWKKCHPIRENEIVAIFERKVIWGCPKMSRNRIAGFNKSTVFSTIYFKEFPQLLEDH